jgi:hypothetical protein
MSQISPWETEGSSKILRIVTAVMGKHILQEWRENRVGFKSMYVLARPLVYDKVKKFSFQKLGEVCSYASKYGYHVDKWEDNNLPIFINWHGFYELGVTNISEIFSHQDFVEVMRQVAVATIIAIAIDYAWQDRMKECWRNPAATGWKLGPQRM